MAQPFIHLLVLIYLLFFLFMVQVVFLSSQVRDEGGGLLFCFGAQVVLYMPFLLDLAGSIFSFCLCL
jgi:hypothetical protein